MLHGFEFDDHTLDHREADLPEFRIAGIEAEGRQQLGVMLRAACRQQREILVDETIVRPLVDAVERVHQAIAECVGVDVERRMDEVRDVGPERFIAGSEADRRAKAFILHRHPQFAEFVGRQLAVPPLQMNLALERIEGDLAHDRVDHVLDLRGQHRLALHGVGGLLEQAAEGQHFAEDACGLGERQRRGRHQRPVGRAP